MGAGRDEAFSLIWTLSGEWALLHGTVDACEPERITQRIMEVACGDSATITHELSLRGARFPLLEQESGATDFQNPRDIFWRRCLDRMPGELLEGPKYERRVALSLVRARAGWKVMRMDEDLEIRAVRWWHGVNIGNRDGIIADDDIRAVPRFIGVDPDEVTVPPDDGEYGEIPWADIEDAFAAAKGLEAAERLVEPDAPMPLPVEVIALESPIKERIGRSHCRR